MQITQLYIDGQRVDMFDDVGISITDTIKDVRDISKVFTEYSQTFSLPASKTNNKIFKHFYNNDIQNGFDARIRVPANIELNSIPFRNGYIKLEGVDLKSNIANTYRITFFGNTISLKNLLGDDLLASLSWLDKFSKKPNGDNLKTTEGDIKEYLTTSITKDVDSVDYVAPIQVPLITHTQRLFYDGDTSKDEVDSGNLHYHSGSGQHVKGVKYNELKYAIKLSVIIKAIEEKYGLNFSNDFFKGGDSSFDNLYMWLHRSKGEVTSGEQLKTSIYTVNDFTDYSLYNGSFMEDSVLTLYDGYYFNNQVLKLSLITTTTNVDYSVTVFRDGVSVYSASGLTGNLTNASISVSNNSSYTIQISSAQTITFDRADWSYTYYDSEEDFIWETYTSSNFNITVDIDFNITQQIPKIKVLDFLTSLFKMFNLVAYVEGSEMVVKTLDDYYDNPSAGSPYDITKYVDVDSSQVNSALPFREVVYSYKGLGTFLAKRHEQLFNEEWGTEEYKGSDGVILSEGIFKNEIPFEHMKFERLLDIDDPNPPTDIQWGFCVDDNQQSYIGKPLIFYMCRKTLTTDERISFVNDVNGDNEAIDHEPISSYYAPTNSDLQATLPQDRQSINFTPEKDEWDLVTKRETLFNSYHKNYISSVFDESNRLKKISAYLPLRILYKYTLADRFVYSGKSYKINSIETDFYTGKSEIELINDYVNIPIDFEAPTAPTNLQEVQGSVTSTSFSITWTASTDNVGVVGYNIDLNQGDIILSAGNVTTYEVTGLSGGTTYVVRVSAFDASGNESSLSNSITVNTLQ